MGQVPSREPRCPSWQPGTVRRGSDKWRVVGLAGFVLIFAVSPVFAQAARAETTVALHAKLKESFGIG
jgi:hypothetical protein